MTTRLGYCLNVHPGETLEQVLAALRGPVTRARELAREPIGVGLYLAAAAVREVLGSRKALEQLRGALDGAGVTVFTANAFPVGGFHSDVVKRAKAGKLTVTHDYAGDPAAIPIPATFTIELGQQITDRSETGVQVRLYRDYPFKSRRGGGSS